MHAEHDLPLTDASHLRTLVICHYVNAGLCLLGLVLIGLQALVLAWMDGMPGAKPDGFAQAWWIFGVMWTVLGAVAVAMATLNIAAARALGRRDRRLLCQVTAGLNCLSVPVGTLLGVFTLLTLERPAVREAFLANDAARRG